MSGIPEGKNIMDTHAIICMVCVDDVLEYIDARLGPRTTIAEARERLRGERVTLASGASLSAGGTCGELAGATLAAERSLLPDGTVVPF